MANPLEELKNDLALAAFGMTKFDAHKQGVCINCKQEPDLLKHIDQEEYRISGLCATCFRKITGEGLD